MLQQTIPFLGPCINILVSLSAVDSTVKCERER